MIQPNPDCLAPSFTSGEAEQSAEDIRTAEVARMIRLAEAGDPSAQTALVRAYTRRISGFVRGIIHQSDSIEDVTQMVFIKMFRRLSRLRDPALFESWLFTLARNTCLDFLRRRKCRPATVTLDDEVNQIADSRDEGATKEILSALDQALTRLSPIDRSLVTHFVAGDSYQDIAARAGLSLASVKVRLHRVRPFLRDCVGGLTETRQPGSRGWKSAPCLRAAA